jgi:COP9 signalosome complex subunit 6
MLHERILVLVKYVTDVIASMSFTFYLSPFCLTCPFKDQAPKDHATLRALNALIASLPATENKAFREEFETVLHSFPSAALPFLSNWKNVV